MRRVLATRGGSGRRTPGEENDGETASGQAASFLHRALGCRKPRAASISARLPSLERCSIGVQSSLP